MARFGVSVVAILATVLAVSFASADDLGIVRQISDRLLRACHSGELQGLNSIKAREQYRS